MKTKRLHFLILIASLIICGFIYLETYAIPLRAHKEIVQNIHEKRVRYTIGSSTRVYLMRTNSGEYEITGAIYDFTSVGDTVLIHHAIISQSVQKISIVKEDGIYTYQNGFARVQRGFFYLPIVIIGILCLLAFYHVIDNPKGAANLTYTLLILTLILLFCHIKS
jgi:hypothetical protein